MSATTSFIWEPSTSRVVVVGGFGPYPRGTLQTAPPALQWPTKDPGDVLDYVIDFSQALEGNHGDSIANVTISITPDNTGDLTLKSVSADGDAAILWLASGIAGTSYDVKILVVTNSGRILSRSVTLLVAALAATSIASVDITDQSGAAITDQNGAPLTTG